MSEPPSRVGLGWDRHRMVEGRRCVIGGVEIPHDRGPLGHSDGDVLLHAATDAVLGAAGLDDLGTLFSDRDERHRGADSSELARLAMERVRAAGFRVLSMDAVLLADAPRIGPHRAAIRASLARLFGLDVEAVNVKGKTSEGDPEGDRRIEATVVALLARSGA